MKLYRFVASDNYKAMMKAQEALGPEAYIYSTHKIAEGIEVLVGVQSDEESIVPLQVQTIPADYKLIENLTTKLQVMSENMQLLFDQMNFLTQVVAAQAQNKKQRNWFILEWFNFELYKLMLLDQLNSMKESFLKFSAHTYHFIRLLKPERPYFIKKF